MAPSKDKRRLLTLNTHSLMEEDTEFCLRTLAEAIISEDVDVAALQEVNQSENAPAVAKEQLHETNCVPCEEEKAIRADNYALALVRQLMEKGQQFYWTWGYAHQGYRVYDEGIALLSRKPITAVLAQDVSAKEQEGVRLCRRKLVGVHTQAGGEDAWFYSVHMGWWKDEQDPFLRQWEKVDAIARKNGEPAYLMGDFNSPAHLRGEGYDLVRACGWEDCYVRALEKDAGTTVGGQIDGWRKEKVDPMRIDFTFAGQAGKTRQSRVIFNGDFYPVISDHFGLLTMEA